jgi:hypothetical protein
MSTFNFLNGIFNSNYPSIFRQIPESYFWIDRAGTPQDFEKKKENPEENAGNFI